MKNSKSKKNSNTIWIALIVMPFAALLLVAVLQIIVHFVTSGATSPGGALITFVNIISVLVGFFAVISLICLPVWIIMLIKNSGSAK